MDTVISEQRQIERNGTPTSEPTQPTPSTAPPGWAVGIYGRSPDGGDPAPLVFELIVHAPQAALDAWGVVLRADDARFLSEFQSARDACEALRTLQRADEEAQAAEARDAQAKVQATTAEAHLAEALRKGDDPSACQAAIRRASTEAWQANERMWACRKAAEDARRNAEIQVELSVEACRKGLQQQSIAKLETTNAALLSAVAPLLVNALAARREVDLLSVPATRAFARRSTFARFSEV